MNDLRRNFHAELDSIKEELVRLAASVTESIPRATQVLLDQDLEGAEYIIMADDEMDARTIAVEERCIADARSRRRSHPTSAMLWRRCGCRPRSNGRLISSSTSARRPGGSTVTTSTRSCAAPSPRWASRPNSSTARRSTPISNWMRRRPARSTTWTHLDGLQKQFVQTIFESHAAGSIDLQVAVQLAVVARFYERIGDHAVNIGERVRYLITGWMPEHVGAARYRSRAESEDADPTPALDGAPARLDRLDPAGPAP